MDLSEQEIVTKAQKGDHDAFMEIINRYEKRVAKTVIGILGDGAEADDIGQEAFLQLYKALHRFRGDSELGTYLTRIAINLSLNELRRRKRQQEAFSSTLQGHLQDLRRMRKQNNKDDIKKIVRRGIQELDPRFKIVVVLRLINGYTTQEAAHILNLPLGTVFSRLARGQAKLKKIIERMYYV
jgi:RNA polymerase sigma-70 factor (ECF subfamily)